MEFGSSMLTVKLLDGVKAIVIKWMAFPFISSRKFETESCDEIEITHKIPVICNVNFFYVTYIFETARYPMSRK